jgi:hypothetical protein
MRFTLSVRRDGIRLFKSESFGFGKGAYDRYGDAEPVTFRYPKVKPDNGKRSPKADISVGKCEPCRRERYVFCFYLEGLVLRM